MKQTFFHLGWLLQLAVIASAAAQAPRAEISAQHRTLLQTHCLKCHQAPQPEGKFRIDQLPSSIADIQSAENWQKVLNALNSNEMPPEDAPQLPAAAKADLLEELSQVMVTARKLLGDQQGAIIMRRLNRREYANTMRTLLGVQVNASELSNDAGNGSLDTVGANLYMSDNQFEQYHALGREALDEAFDQQATAHVRSKFRYEVEDSTPIIKQLVAEEDEARERAFRWFKAVEEAAARPENAEIVAEIRKTAKDEALFRRSWAKIKGAPSPEEFGFITNETPADKANRAGGRNDFNAYHHYYINLPALDRGGYLTVRNDAVLKPWVSMLVPFGYPVGDYMVRVCVGATPDAPAERKFVEFGINPRHGQVESTYHVTGTIDKPQVIEIPLTFTHQHDVRENRTLFIREKGTCDDIYQSRRRFSAGMKQNGIGPESVLWIDWMEIERLPPADRPLPPGIAALGIPLDDKSPPPTAEALQAAWKRFATEAFRGVQPSKAYLTKLDSFYQQCRQAGDRHSVALKETLAVVLASPKFLYLAEHASDAKRQPLSQHELASRLSYFLWGAPPDAELRKLAERGELNQPAVLLAQTNRLLDDPRSDGFVTPFVEQWLGLDRLDFFQINGELHPRFDASTKLAARQEVLETFRYLLLKPGRLGDLLKADYVVINAVLADYYGLPGVSGDEFRRVPLPANSPRGGLLGMAAVHVMGGNGEQSNPVERGAWVLRKLLNDPPPPTPANVPAITRLAGQPLTTRERILLHQEAPQCASCHRKIDPIGFGLENFNAVGLWRTEDSYQVTDPQGKAVAGLKKTWTIDPAATLHNGPAFKDFFELRTLIADQEDAFSRGFSSLLIEYALGRPCNFSDEPLIEQLLQHAQQQQGSLRSYIHALVSSQAFQSK